MAKELHKIINAAWKEGHTITPEEWKKLVILHKTGSALESKSKSKFLYSNKTLYVHNNN